MTEKKAYERMVRKLAKLKADTEKKEAAILKEYRDYLDGRVPKR